MSEVANRKYAEKPACHVGDRDGRDTDRETGTGSEAKPICLPSFVTPHLRVRFTDALGISFFHFRLAFAFLMVAADFADAEDFGIQQQQQWQL